MTVQQEIELLIVKNCNSYKGKVGAELKKMHELIRWFNCVSDEDFLKHLKTLGETPKYVIPQEVIDNLTTK
jgi:hypothetical protein